MPCLPCGGRAGRDGCAECHGRGWVAFTGCPSEFANAIEPGSVSVWTLKEMADYMESGMPPVSGGVLDQAQVFWDGCKEWWKQKSIWMKRR